MKDYIQLQLSLERIGLNDQGFLVRIPGPDPDDIARLYAFCDSNSYSMYIRADVPRSIKNQLSTLGPEKAFADHSSVEGIFELDDPCDEIRHWETYILQEEPSAEKFPSVITIPRHSREYDQRASPYSSLENHVILQDEKILSSCVSVRESDASAECYVFTEIDYRRRGFGRQVTASWAVSIIKKEKVPFYSYARGNEPSRKLASSLGFLHAHSLVTYV